MEQLINNLKAALTKTLPGAEAQYLMAPFHRKKIEDDLLKLSQFKPSAVLIVLCFDELNKPFIPLIERVSYNGAHSGQISLPGGKFDTSDESLARTAIRECFEEIGLTDIELLGQLTEIKIPVSQFLVHPFVGVCRFPQPNLILQEREVKSILKLHIEDLLKEEIVKVGKVVLSTNLELNTAWYDVEGYQVWGATAMILSELKELMKTIS